MPAAFIALAFFLLAFGGWVTHVVKCISEWTQEYLIFLVVGALMAPIGVVHGWFIWAQALFGG